MTFVWCIYFLEYLFLHCYLLQQYGLQTEPSDALTTVLYFEDLSAREREEVQSRAANYMAVRFQRKKQNVACQRLEMIWETFALLSFKKIKDFFTTSLKWIFLRKHGWWPGPCLKCNFTIFWYCLLIFWCNNQWNMEFWLLGISHFVLSLNCVPGKNLFN